MDDQLKAAFASATETVKNALTLSTAVLTVSITFVKDVNKSPTMFQVWILEASWVFLLLAVVSGVVTLMAITGCLAKNNPLVPDTLYASNVRVPMSIAILSFLLGVGLTAAYGMLSI